MKFISIVAAGIALAGNIPPAAEGKTTLSYMVPKTVIDAEVRQTLTACPERADELPSIETVWDLVPTAAPSRNEATNSTSVPDFW